MTITSYWVVVHDITDRTMMCRLQWADDGIVHEIFGRPTAAEIRECHREYGVPADPTVYYQLESMGDPV